VVEISSKPEYDPIAKMVIVDAYMRWGLEAVRKAIGQDGLEFVLRQAGLERMIDDPPSGEMIVTDVTFGDYANFNAALLNHFQRPGKSMVLRMGRESAQMAITFQRTLFNLATVIAAKMLPTQVQLKMGLSAMMAGYRTLSQEKAGQEFKGTIEDRGDQFAFILETCPLCAGKQANACIGWMMEATIEEACQQVFGKFFDVVETECRAKGDPAGVWLVPKQPGEEDANTSASMD
jgi:predicted hydrocarbon binding protein